MANIVALGTQYGIIEILVVAVVAVSMSFATAAALLKKMGVLHFSRSRAQIKEGNAKPCEFHQDLVALVAKLHDVQIGNVIKHEQHINSFAVGEKKFDALQDAVSELREGVGILMDRSGGRPESWSHRKKS